MARKRKAASHDSTDGKMNSDVGDAAKALGRARKRFVGVRQRPSGRWVAEIKDTIQKIRVWLGTFDTAEEAARAYDEAACMLRGANTRTNFWPGNPNSSFPSPALPSKITNLLLTRLNARNNALAANNNFDPNSLSSSPSSPPRSDQNQGNQHLDEASDFPDFFYDPDEEFALESYSRATSDYGCPILETGASRTMQANTLDLIQDSSENENETLENNSTDMEDVGFQFVDEIGCPIGFSAFEIAEEMAKPTEVEDGAMAMMSEAMKRINYERKFSASLYAFNGITEYLNLKKLKKSSVDNSDHLTRLRHACKSKQEEMMSSNDKEEHSSDLDGDELSIWSSIDLPPLCFVN